MIQLYIVSSNHFYSYALKTLLNNNSVLFASVFCGDVYSFLSHKIAKDQNNILLLHTESLQNTKEQLLVGQVNFSLFSKVIVVDAHEEVARKKVQLKSVYFSFISSTLVFKDFVIALFSAIDGADTQQGKMVEEAVVNLQTLRYLHYSQRFLQEELDVLNLFKEDMPDKAIMEKLGFSTYKYNLLKSSIAEKFQVANNRTSILIKALATGIIKTDEPDETFNLPLFL